jgi:hypothetical protein
VAAPPPNYGDGPHACRAGEFRLFGDLELIERIRPTAEQTNFAPYRVTP